MHNIYVEEPKQNEHKTPQLFDIISRLILPVAIVVAGIFRNLNVYLLVLFVILALIVTYYRRLAAFIRARRDKVHDGRIVAENLKQLRQLSREAGDYFDVSTSRTDSIPGIMQELGIRNHQAANAIHLPHLGIFQEHWKFLNHRIQNEKMNADDFHNAANELTSLVHLYNSYYVYPLFYTYAAELREVLSANEKSKLNAFQQKYVAFLTAYTKYITRVGEDFRTLPKLHAGMPFPNPL